MAGRAGAGAASGGVAGSADGGTGAEGGASGQSVAGDGGGPGPCDPDAPEVGCSLSGAEGVFVSADGDDDDDGSQAKPVQSIKRAVDLATAKRNAIYVCAGNYRERVVIAKDGLVLRGGYACDSGTWTYGSSVPTRVAPSEEVEALRVENVRGFSLVDVELYARPATHAGGSSVAAFVTGSSGVTFTRLHAIASRGADGESGASGMDRGSNYTTDDQDGRAGTATTGARFQACTCGNGDTTTGGSGGSAVSIGSGADGLPMLEGGLGGDKALDCTEGGAGGKGADAASVDDAAGASRYGSIDPDEGWQPEAGEDGETGTPAQGGGGGKGASDGGGGGGACGGCSGTGGGRGSGGGGSIALLATNSTLTLVASRLEAADGGDGGQGGTGEPGQEGGKHGTRYGYACDGGDGGRGADGANGGGGAGGISVGVLFDHSTMLELDEKTTFSLGDPGASGAGGGADNAGISGLAAKLKQI
jgi:hypothetical protein